MEIWLTPRMGFDLTAGRVRLLGSGENRLNWISFRDAAAAAAACADGHGSRSELVDLSGDYLRRRGGDRWPAAGPALATALGDPVDRRGALGRPRTVHDFAGQLAAT